MNWLFSIDAIRAIAILAVICKHTRPFSTLGGFYPKIVSALEYLYLFDPVTFMLQGTNSHLWFLPVLIYGLAVLSMKNKLLTALGKLTLGVYLCHWMIINALLSIRIFYHAAAWELMFPLLAYGLSLALTAMMLRWRYTAKLVLA
jgi:peptidoglycan/LPS O-acetylase OafA/YrhL